MSSGVPFINPNPNGTRLENLVNVTVVQPLTDSQVLTYDAATSRWENKDVPGGTASLAGLTDVTLTGPTDGQTLIYDDADGRWKNETVPFPIIHLGNDNEQSSLADVAVIQPIADGASLVFDSGNNNWITNKLPRSLVELTDVDALAPTNGHVLTYNNTSTKWESAPTQIQLSDVGGVALDLPLANAEALVYDVGTTSWTNKQVILQNGNAFSASVTVGTNDAHDLRLETDNVTKFTVDKGSDPTLYVEGQTYGVISTRDQAVGDSAGLFLRTGGADVGTVQEMGIVAGSTQTGVAGKIQLTAGSANVTGGIAGDVEIRAGYGVDGNGSTRIYNDIATYLEVRPSGLVSSNVADYNTLVVAPGDLTDKAYVDGAITTAISALPPGVTTLDGLTDVTLGTLVDGQALVYNGLTTQWENADINQEATTASNVNVAGVGVFKGKTGDDLEFKGINAGSAKITVTDDPTNNEIDIDLGAVALDDLSDVVVTGAANGQLLQYNGTNWVNSNLLDSTTVIGDNVDPTKRIQFQASSITTGTTRTYTAPNADGTIALTATSWQTAGNNISGAGFLGSTTAQPVTIQTNNAGRVRFESGSNTMTTLGAFTIQGSNNSSLTINAGPESLGIGGILTLSGGNATGGTNGNHVIVKGGSTGVGTSGNATIQSTNGGTSGTVTVSTGNGLNVSGNIDIFTGTGGTTIGTVRLTTGGPFATGKGFQVEADGTLSVVNTANYSSLVTADNDMPNLKAVKDNTMVLTNKSLSDTTTTVENVTDATKKIKFDVSSVTTATTRTYKANDSDGTLVLSIPTSAEVKMDVAMPMGGDSFVYDNVAGTWKNRMMSCAVGELWYQNDTGATVTLTTQNTWYLINPPDTLETNASAFPSAQFDNPVDGRIRYIGTHTQAFHTAFSWCASTPNAGDVWEFAVYKNGVEVTGSKITSDFISNNTITSFAFHKVVNMTTNDYIELFVRNTSQNSRSMVFRNVNLVLMGTMCY